MKTLTSLISILLISMNALADVDTSTQSIELPPSAPTWRSNSVHVKVGSSYSNTKTFNEGDASLDQDRRTGLAASIGVEFPLSTQFSVLPEVGYIQKGFEFTMSVFNEETKAAFKFDYIQLPLQAKFYLSENTNSSRVYLIAGPYAAWAVSRSGTLTYSFDGESINDKVNLDDSVRSFDYGYRAGLGIDIPFSGSNTRIGLGLHYEAGLAAIDKGSDEGSSIKNRSWIAQLGVAF